MSVQFGRWNFDNAPPAPGRLEKASQLLAPYGPDGEGRYSGPGVDIIYRGFHTTKESRREKQPHAAPSGAVITWDGRLDNREELIRQLSGGLSIESTDVAIVAAAYEKWGTDSFGKLMGDWALAIWDPRDQALILAKDFVGTRHLYYAIEKDQVTWSSILDPLVLLAGKQFTLEEEYIAGWLGFFPATHLTPYVGIQAVPPSSFVRIRGGKPTVRQYWDFDPGKRIRYRTDAEYEEHFRNVFAESVRRRLRSDTPVLAELSGGMDSSSIVCTADKIIEEGCAETPRLDTVSYYDDQEPNWNERPYFTKVEEKRGRTGCHIDLGSEDAFPFQFENDRFAATPASLHRHNEASRQFAACMLSGKNRVVLSGIGGDEVLGGVPTPIPELADFLARFCWRNLAHQLKVWALNKKKPWFHLCFEAARGFLPRTLVGIPEQTQSAWLVPSFAKRHRDALAGYPPRFRLVGPLPSFQENVRTFESLRRQLAGSAFPSELFYEKRYPYLDRDLVESIFAIPREQLVRPGQRRSLARRALAGIVPDAILDRKRKAFVVRSSMTTVLVSWTRLLRKSTRLASTTAGFVDPKALREVLQRARDGKEIPVVTLLRTLGLEFWLQGLNRWELHRGIAPGRPGAFSIPEDPDFGGERCKAQRA
ncbi:MAG TPA: asparagine synthase-related protein [Candidatus Acidoferrales bacterium]|nr:asparagine synthase-related protein [Candidatus Acidoferrales bacterium]